MGVSPCEFESRPGHFKKSFLTETLFFVFISGLLVKKTPTSDVLMGGNYESYMKAYLATAISDTCSFAF